jgi:hypothetical protein
MCKKSNSSANDSIIAGSIYIKIIEKAACGQIMTGCAAVWTLVCGLSLFANLCHTRSCPNYDMARPNVN